MQSASPSTAAGQQLGGTTHAAPKPPAISQRLADAFAHHLDLDQMISAAHANVDLAGLRRCEGEVQHRVALAQVAPSWRIASHAAAPLKQHQHARRHGQWGILVDDNLYHVVICCDALAPHGHYATLQWSNINDGGLLVRRVDVGATTMTHQDRLIVLKNVLGSFGMLLPGAVRCRPCVSCHRLACCAPWRPLH
jgi:hypothetical protein